MANISQDLYLIETAGRGEVVRDAIIDAMKKINKDFNLPGVPGMTFSPSDIYFFMDKNNHAIETTLEL